MEAKVRVLASGSSGNAVFVACGDTRILVDAGVSAARLHRSLGEISESADDLSAVLITHEHTDHVNGLTGIRSRWSHVPILTTAGTAKEIEKRHGVGANDPPLTSGTPIEIGAVRIVPFAVSHDAAEPVGLRLDCGDFAVGVATDLGTATAGVEAMLSGCRVLVLEANHDTDMLQDGPYPVFLKKRIASARGHLSNRQSAALLAKVAAPSLDHVFLAHLSRTNNTPGRAVAEVSAAMDQRHDIEVEAARPHEAGPVLSFDVAARPAQDLSAAMVPPPVESPRPAPGQLRLFD